MPDNRSQTDHDYDKILYSPFLRRLSGVTQVITPDPSLPRRHSRLEHSHKVSSLAREIAHDVEIERKQTDPPIDISAAAAAGLAHDLGHPPFGHAGEVVLNHFLAEREKLAYKRVVDGYEGNAQTFRIVSVLDRKTSDGQEGLNLSPLTLAAIAKYPWPRATAPWPAAKNEWAPPPKFSAFTTEESSLDAAMTEAGQAQRPYSQTPEASIMDLADDITYAFHDLEDFFVSHGLNFQQVGNALLAADNAFRKQSIPDQSVKANPFVVKYDILVKEFRTVEDGGYVNKTEYREALEIVNRQIVANFIDRFDNSPLANGDLRSTISLGIANAVKSIRYTPDAPQPWRTRGYPTVYLDSPQWHRIQVLKAITGSYLIQTRQMFLIERSQRTILGEVLDELERWVTEGVQSDNLPEPLRSYLKDFQDEDGQIQLPATGSAASRLSKDGKLKYTSIYRALADYVAGLSDMECHLLHGRMRGLDIPGPLPTDGWN